MQRLSSGCGPAPVFLEIRTPFGKLGFSRWFLDDPPLTRVYLRLITSRRFAEGKNNAVVTLSVLLLSNLGAVKVKALPTVYEVHHVQTGRNLLSAVPRQK